jgi:hypothetical protein
MSRRRWSFVVFAGSVAAGAMALGATHGSARADGGNGTVGSSATVPSVRSAAQASTSAAMGGGSCPTGMTLVEGDYCPHLEQHCLRWLDPPGPYHRYRCAEYARPAQCLAPKLHKRFCIDLHERTEAESDMPANDQSWMDAKQACEAAGARVCTESEWTFACEGQDMQPYPYGWERKADRCNADRSDLIVPGHPRKLVDDRDPVGTHPDCKSPFGLLDMAGNVAEWVSVDGHTDGSEVVQKGNWWQPGKHACRDAQAGHNRFYKGTETGFRCCARAPN